MQCDLQKINEERVERGSEVNHLIDFVQFRLTLASFNHNSIVLNQSLTTKRLAVASEGENVQEVQVHCHCTQMVSLDGAGSVAPVGAFPNVECFTVLHCDPAPAPAAVCSSRRHWSVAAGCVASMNMDLDVTQGLHQQGRLVVMFGFWRWLQRTLHNVTFLNNETA